MTLANQWPMLSAITLYNLAKRHRTTCTFGPICQASRAAPLASSNVTTEETARQSFQSLYN